MALVNYDIDFKKMVEQLSGGLLRKTIRVAWLTAVMKPLRNLHIIFLNYTAGVVNDIKWNGQTIILEQKLIERFGSGIFITNNVVEVNGAFIGSGADNSFFIGENDDNPQFIDITYNITDYNFIVNVPSAIVFTMSEMQAIINKYKLHGTTYNIVIF